MRYSLITLRDKTILFVEDDVEIQNTTKEILQAFFKQVIVASNGIEGYDKYLSQNPDILFTDIKMPLMDGLELVSQIRAKDIEIPIVLFTAHNEQKYLMRAINMQVEGFITKPLKLEEMLEIFSKCTARINARKPSIIEFENDVVYHTISNSLVKNGEKIKLGSKEYALLKLLVERYPNLLEKEEIIIKLYPIAEIGESTLKNIVSRLRAKIGFNAIESISGIGWRLLLNSKSV